jgi:2,3-bisphosphoglycerate-dependent phosphoglycerate mutase
MKREHLILRRRPLLTPVWIAALTGAAAVMALFWWWSAADVTTIIVIRHAEKELGSISDPPLSTAGEERAALLARMFGEPRGAGRIDAIYATEMRRAQATALPLAARLRLPIVATAEAPPAQLAARVLRDHRGARVLIVGHSNTVPEIVKSFAGTNDIEAISEQDYGTMYIISVPRVGRPNVLRLRY